MILPPGARVQGDGSITFPIKGSPPKLNLPGYVQDPTDAYRWVLDYKPCRFRQIGLRVKCPLGQKLVDNCLLLGLYVGPKYCQGCTKRET